MSKVSIQGDASGTGTLTIAAPNTNSNYTLTLPTNTGTVMTSASNTFSGGLTLGGDLTLDSNGIYLGGTGAANYLDDYEEGSFTPAYTATSGSFNYSHQYGKYVKVGNLVFFAIYLRGNKDTMSGPVTITGLPFTSSSSNNVSGGAFKTYATGFLTDMPNLSFYIDNDDTVIQLYINATNAATATTTDANFTNTVNANYILASGVYQAA